MALTFHPKSLNQTNVYVRTLTISDLDRCVELENASFSEEERCSPEKFKYRLTICPELSHGLFTMTKPHPHTPTGISSFRPQEVLIAQIIATKTSSPRITDAAMRIPKQYLPRFAPHLVAQSPSASQQSSSQATTSQASQTIQRESTPTPSVSQSSTSDSKTTLVGSSPTSSKTGASAATATDTETEDSDEEGHVEAGDTVAIHSLCVTPAYRRMGYSQILLKDFISRMRDAGVSKRIALIAHGNLIPVYTKADFKNMGVSAVKFAGGNWTDLVYEYSAPPGKGGLRRGG